MEHLWNDDDISMEEVMSPANAVNPVTPVRARTTVMFNGVERDARAVLPDGTLASSGFTDDETRRARDLARPFNEKYNNEDVEVSMSMWAGWMDADGKFIFKVIDDLVDSTREFVHENELTEFLAR